MSSELDPEHPVRSMLRILPYRPRIAVAVAVFIVKDSPLWLLPVIASFTIDVVVKGGPVANLGWLAIGGAVLLLQNYPTHMLFTRMYMGSVRQMTVNLRNALTERLQVLSIGFHAKSSAAVVQNKVVQDVENIQVMFSQSGNPALSAVFVFAGSIVMTALNVPQFLPVFALTVPAGIGIWWVIRKRAFKRNEEFRHEMERFSSRVGEMATLVPITRAHGLEAVAAERVAEVAESVRSVGLRLDILNGGFNAISWVAMQLLSVSCLLLAAFLSVQRWAPISAGQVVLLSTYFGTLTGAVTTVLNLYPLASRASASLRSIAEVLHEPDLELNEGKTQVENIAGKIELKALTIAYSGDSPAALDHVDLTILPGESVAFVGPSGSGKSSLLNAVLGFVRPTSGQVLLDDVDMNLLDLRSVRRHTSVVPQESVLFEGSIRDNVTYGLGPVADDIVMEALEQANALEIVEALPLGWYTTVGERGARLSGGQRQRLSIARALIRDPRILVLDEATSALDSESEAKIQSALEHLIENRTTLVVAHRLSTVRNADRIVVLDHGRINEVGPHDLLVKSGGPYARMWGQQRGGIA